jgi:hypothetical protein
MEIIQQSLTSHSFWLNRIFIEGNWYGLVKEKSTRQSQMWAQILSQLLSWLDLDNFSMCHGVFHMKKGANKTHIS